MSCSTSLAAPWLPQSRTTAAEHLTTFLALPSWSILQRPAHSPSFMFESTLIRGIPVLLAESSDQLLVHRLVAVLSEDAEQGLPLVKGLGGLPQATGKTISDQSLLEHLLDRLVDTHGAGGLDGRGARHISFNIRHVGILDCAKYSCRSESSNKSL